MTIVSGMTASSSENLGTRTQSLQMEWTMVWCMLGRKHWPAWRGKILCGRANQWISQSAGAYSDQLHLA
jgi:hypothetical protein